MAKSKEYQVRTIFDGVTKQVTDFDNKSDALDDFSESMYHLSWFLTFKNYALVELIEISDGISRTLNFHGYGEIPKEKQSTT